MNQEQAIESLYAAGHWLLGEERPRAALEVFRLMTMVSPLDERSWLGIGLTHQSLSETEIAIELFTLGASAARSVRCHLARARAFRSLGQDDLADSAIEDARLLAHELDDAELLGLAELESGQ